MDARALITDAGSANEMVRMAIDDLDMAVAILASALGPDVAAAYLRLLAAEAQALPVSGT